MDTICLDAFGNSVKHLTQWDANQSLFVGNSEKLTTAPLFHFYNEKSSEALVVGSNFTDDSKDVIEVKVPNILLQEALPLYVFIYAYSDESSGKSIAEFRINVHERAKPSSYTYVENIDEYSVNGVETTLRNEMDDVKRTLETQIGGCVSFTENQVLTDAQKELARNNISTVGKRCSDTAESFNDYRERGEVVDENAVTVTIGNVSSGDYAHAEGTGTTASGKASHAEGKETIATGENSHAEGFKTASNGNYAHSEGSNTSARGESAHAEGAETTASNSEAHAEGYRTVAKGMHSHAEGNGSQANGDNAHSEGNGSQANGESAHAEGNGTIASSNNTHAEGLNTVASGINSHAEGYCTVAKGESSHAEGSNTTALGNCSHAQGYSSSQAIASIPDLSSSTKDTDIVTAWGTNKFSLAKGANSSVSGKDCLALEENSHAEGYITQARGGHSHSEGYMTTALGYYSHTEGYDTFAMGNSAHAEGCGASADGDFSHASGYETQAAQGQFVIGKYNITQRGVSSIDVQSIHETIFIVGNGTSTARSNAFRIASDGTCFGKSAFNASGADFAEYFEWLDGNPDDEDRRGHFVTLDGDKIKFATSEDKYILGIVSSAGAFIGNSSSEDWQGKYLKDVFGSFITQEVKIAETTDERTGKIIPAHTATQLVVNPNYNPDEKYVSREFRKEWSPVGFHGQIVAVDDGTCQVNGYCMPSVNGIATASESGYRIMKRIDSTHILVLMR